MVGFSVASHLHPGLPYLCTMEPVRVSCPPPSLGSRESDQCVVGSGPSHTDTAMKGVAEELESSQLGREGGGGLAGVRPSPLFPGLGHSLPQGLAGWWSWPLCAGSDVTSCPWLWFPGPPWASEVRLQGAEGEAIGG